MQPVNFNFTDANETFSNGGYYQYDFPNSSLSFIALNTMFFNIKNKCMLDKGNEQLIWFNNLLSSNNNSATPRHFVIGMHVFPGLNDYYGVEHFWYDNYTS